MLDKVKESPFFARYFPFLCSLLGEDPRERLEETGYCSRNEVASLLTVFVSAIRYSQWREKGNDFSICSGYSVGQLTALYAAGIWDLETLLKTVHRRALYMNECMHGRDTLMAAVIGLPNETVEHCCREVSEGGHFVAVSNYNCVGQLTISGDASAVREVMEKLKEHKPRKLQEIPTSGAWHCSLLEPAAWKFEKYLATVPFREATVLVTSNLDGALLPHNSKNRMNPMLAKMLSHPVKWSACVKKMVENRANEIIECGHGDVLTKFGFFIDRSVKHRSLDD